MAATKTREKGLWPSKIRVGAKTAKHRKNVRTRGIGSLSVGKQGMDWKWNGRQVKAQAPGPEGDHGAGRPPLTDCQVTLHEAGTQVGTVGNTCLRGPLRGRESAPRNA